MNNSKKKNQKISEEKPHTKSLDEIERELDSTERELDSTEREYYDAMITDLQKSAGNYENYHRNNKESRLNPEAEEPLKKPDPDDIKKSSNGNENYPMKNRNQPL